MWTLYHVTDNGFAGLDTEFVFNSPLHVKHIGQLADWQSNGIFTYGGRRGDGNPLFADGKCAMLINSSAYYSGLRQSAKFDFGTSQLPYWSGVEGAPQNSIIGGATLWVLTGHPEEEYQRVAMGRAIVREPSVFLFDEPLSNLDAKLRVQMRLEIKKLQERLGITSVYVTHDQVEAMTPGHRLMVLNNGYVEQLGTPIELYERPATEFVAGFIGSPSMNFLQARVSEDGNEAMFPGGDVVRLCHNLSGQANHMVNIGIRPEHLKEVEVDNRMFSQKVELIEHLGADTLVHGTLGDSSCRLTVRLGGIRTINQNEVISLNVGSRDIHVFDTNTGKRL